MLILVDGPAASGKGALGLRLAEHFGFFHLDSGNWYRAVVARMLETGETHPVDVAESLIQRDFKRDLRTEQVSKEVPAISCLPEVRLVINQGIRDVIAVHSGAVMDGRAGAAEFPEAEVKIYLTASEEVRAWRRVHQLGLGEDYYLRVLLDMRERDWRDRQRATSPLVKAEDAVEIDSSEMNADQVFRQALQICEEKLGTLK